MSVPALTDQQGVPVRTERDRARRPADPRGRGPARRRRRDGVDDATRRTSLPKMRFGARMGDAEADRLDDVRRPVLRVRPGVDGRGDRRATTSATSSRARSRTSSPRARTSSPRRPSRPARSTTRSFPSRSRSARATRSSSPKDEGVRADTTIDSLAQAASGLLEGRDDHRRQRVADLRRRRGDGRHVARRGRQARARAARDDRRARHGRRTGRVAARAAGQRDQGRAREDRHQGVRPRRRRDQRGVRVRRRRVRRAT